MRELLDNDFIEALVGHALDRADDVMEEVRETLFAVYDEGGTPAGFARLRAGSEDRNLVERLVMKRAEQEQRGMMPGTLNSEMMQHPEFRRMVAEDLQGVTPELPEAEALA